MPPAYPQLDEEVVQPISSNVASIPPAYPQMDDLMLPAEEEAAEQPVVQAPHVEIEQVVLEDIEDESIIPDQHFANQRFMWAASSSTCTALGWAKVARLSQTEFCKSKMLASLDCP